jgi:hypothetical protein
MAADIVKVLAKCLALFMVITAGYRRESYEVALAPLA